MHGHNAAPLLMFAKPIAILGLVLTLHASRGAELLLVTNSNGETQSLNDFLTGEGHVVTRDDRTSGPGDVSAFDLVIVARETNSGSYDDGSEPEAWPTSIP